ncbi:MAG: ABC transporter permease, partial [Deltaproteobacteria bacterium]|nr:ABC transporter permease [Deltaproteobacteria bacterium]
HHPDYLEKRTAGLTLEGAAGLVAAVEAVPGVAAVSPRLLFSGAIRSSTSSTVQVVRVLAVDPAREARTSALADKVVEGGFLAPPPGSNDPDAPLRVRSRHGMLLGVELARHLRVELGSKVRLDTAGFHGATAASAFHVTGILETGSDSFDRQLVMVPLDAMQGATGAGDAVHEIAVTVSDLRDIEAVTAEIRSAVGGPEGSGGVAVQPWWEVSPDIKQMLDLSRSWNAFLYLLMMVILSAGILTTMFMVIYERRREFGVQLALGTGPWSLFRGVMLEALWIACVAAGIGLVLGRIAVYFLEEYGIDLSFLVGGFDFQGLFIENVYRGASTPEVFVEPTLVVVLGTLAFALWPALRVARMKALDGIRQGGQA